MPVETIKCKECGSTDVTEFRPDSFICGHCESVFKHLRQSNPGGSSAVCEIDKCGVSAIGRCEWCSRPVCGGHLKIRRAQEIMRTYPSDAVGKFCTECELHEYESYRQASEVASERRVERSNESRAHVKELQLEADILVRKLAGVRKSESTVLRFKIMKKNQKVRAWRVFQWLRVNPSRDSTVRMLEETFYLTEELKLMSESLGSMGPHVTDRENPLDIAPFEEARCSARARGCLDCPYRESLGGSAPAEAVCKNSSLHFWESAVATLRDSATGRRG
jgi:hypothetical protein